MRLIIGILMFAVLFAGFFLLMASVAGWRMVAISFFVALVSGAWIIVAAYLVCTYIQ